MKGFRGQINHLAPARMFQPIAFQSRVSCPCKCQPLSDEVSAKIFLCCGCTSHFYWRWAWSRGRKQRKEAEPADSEFPKGSRAADPGSVTAAGLISPLSRMAPAREGQVREQKHLDSLLSSAQISVYYSVSQCLSSPSVNPSFGNLLLQPHLEISVLSHFIPTKYIEGNGVLSWCLNIVIQETLKTGRLYVFYKIYFSHNQGRNYLRL